MITALQFIVAFILVLAPLVFFHELGHFLVAKALRIGVPVFSLGFGPRLFGFRQAETDYRVSLIPLGGYVRLAGDEADEHRVGAPEEFLSRPKWQRFVVYSAGAVFNVVLAFLVMWFFFGYYGKVEAPYPVIHDVRPGSPAAEAGIQRGDRLIAIAGHNVRDTRDFVYYYNLEIALAPDTRKTIEIERDGRKMEVELNTGSDPTLGTGDPGWGISRGGGDSPVISRVLDGGAAAAAGLRPGDRIVGGGGKEPITGLELQLLLERNVGHDVVLLVEREGKTIPISVRPRPSKEGRTIGIDFVQTPIRPTPLGVGRAAVESFRWNLDSSKILFVVLKRLFTAELSLRTMSGPVGIAQVARQALISGPDTFLYLLGFFSLQLGILNLLPIPILDGGHILILLIESVMRRNLSERVKERVMQAGLVFLLAFMSVIIFLDLSKLDLSRLF